MKRNQIQEGRISDHTHGMGNVTWQMVRQRARELAVINGRLPREVLDSDFEQARRELTGQDDISPQEQAIESLPEFVRTLGSRAGFSRSADSKESSRR